MLFLAALYGKQNEKTEVFSGCHCAQPQFPIFSDAWETIVAGSKQERIVSFLKQDFIPEKNHTQKQNLS